MSKVSNSILYTLPFFETSNIINENFILNNYKLISFNYLTEYFIENNKLVIHKNFDLFYKYIDLFNWYKLSKYVTFENFYLLKEFQSYLFYTEINDPVLKESLKVMINKEKVIINNLNNYKDIYIKYPISYMYCNYIDFDVHYIFKNRNLLNFHYLVIYGFNIINHIYEKCTDEFSIKIGNDLLSYFSFPELIKNLNIKIIYSNNQYYLVNKHFLLKFE